MKTILKNEFRLLRTYPANYSATDSQHFMEDFDVNIKENHVRIYKKASIVQLYLFNGLCLQKEYCLTRKASSNKKLKAYIKCLIFKKRKINEGLWVLDQWSSGYFHWFTEVLPRIISGKEINKDAKVLLPLHHKQNDFILESLRALKTEAAFYDINRKIVVNKLFAPSHLKPAQFDPEYILQVRDAFQSNLPKDIPQKKIYISRKKANRRKILNEHELNNMLSALGFITVYMEELSFSNQKDLMNETKILISNHGAGLTNMLFMKEGSLVIELKADALDINNCFFNLAKALNHRYYYTINKGDSNEIQKANINVDLIKLEELLSAIN